MQIGEDGRGEGGGGGGGGGGENSGSCKGVGGVGGVGGAIFSRGRGRGRRSGGVLQIGEKKAAHHGPIAVVIIHGHLCRSRERGSVSHRHSMSVSQSGSYFTVPPRAHPSTESNFGCFSWEPSSLGHRPEVTIVTRRDPLS